MNDLKFDLENYKEEIEELLSDIFYLEGQSFRGKTSDIRLYSEFIIRQLLNISGDDFLTLGERNTKEKLRELSNDDNFLMDSIEVIRRLGNKTSHSQNLRKINEEQYKNVLINLLNLQGYLFINFFKNFKFGNNEKIVSAFSILPPALRQLILEQLYLFDNKNISIIDKLSIAILKNQSKAKAFEWIENNKTNLYQLECVSEKAKIDISHKYGENYLKQIILNAPDNMYIYCKENINNISLTLEREGKLYESYEEAKELYLKKGIINDNSTEVLEFNSIMEFLYTGRKEQKNDKLKNLNNYISFKD